MELEWEGFVVGDRERQSAWLEDEREERKKDWSSEGNEVKEMERMEEHFPKRCTMNLKCKVDTT